MLLKEHWKATEKRQELSDLISVFKRSFLLVWRMDFKGEMGKAGKIQHPYVIKILHKIGI